MFYPVTFKSNNSGEKTYWMPDLGLVSPKNSLEDSLDYFAENLCNFIEDNFRKQGKPIPTPSEIKEEESYIACPLKLEARILLWNLLRDKHMSTSEFARLVGMSRQQAQFLVDGSRPVSMDMYYDAFKALGYYLSLELNPYK